VHFKNEESKEKAKEISRIYKGKPIYFCNSETVTCFSCGEKGHMAGDHNKNTNNPKVIFQSTVAQQKPQVPSRTVKEETKKLDEFDKRLKEIESLLVNLQTQKTDTEKVKQKHGLDNSDQSICDMLETESEAIDKVARNSLQEVIKAQQMMQEKLLKLEQEMNTNISNTDTKLDKILNLIVNISPSPAQGERPNGI